MNREAKIRFIAAANELDVEIYQDLAKKMSADELDIDYENALRKAHEELSERRAVSI